jgi:membrane protease YdiL (CAAX protease family)
LNNKIVKQFLILTFFIAVVAWGICAVFKLFGFTIENTSWLWVFITLCAFSPTIASYVILKRNNEVKSFKEWLKNVFAVKSPFRHYLLVIMLLIVNYIPLIILSGMGEAKPFYMFFVLLLGTLIGGGIEEAGWRYILQPELDKKFGLILSSIIVGVIWAAWHIPVFLPQGRLESLSWFGLFTIECLSHSFAYGTIVRITKNVFMSVLFHTLSNAVSATFFTYSDSLFPDSHSTLVTVLSAGLLIVVSLTVILIYEKSPIYFIKGYKK